MGCQETDKDRKIRENETKKEKKLPELSDREILKSKTIIDSPMLDFATILRLVWPNCHPFAFCGPLLAHICGTLVTQRQLILSHKSRKGGIKLTGFPESEVAQCFQRESSLFGPGFTLAKDDPSQWSSKK